MKYVCLLLILVLAVACGSNTPQAQLEPELVEVTREVEVVTEVEVTREVEVEVTREVTVEIERVVTATPQPVTPTPEPSATVEAAISLAAGTYSYFQPQFSESMYFVGEIINSGPSPAWQVEIAISVLDTNNNVLGASSTNIAELQVARPDEPFPYLILIDGLPAPEQWANVEIQVNGEPYDEEDALFPPHLDLQLEGVTPATDSTGRFTLNGRVLNAGDATAELVHIIAIAYDEAGTVVDVGDTYADLDEIVPGGNASFSLDFRRIETAPANYIALVQGYEVSE